MLMVPPILEAAVLSGGSNVWEQAIATRAGKLLNLRCRLAIAAASTGASPSVNASAPVLYFVTITLLRRLASSGPAERQFTQPPGDPGSR